MEDAQRTAYSRQKQAVRDAAERHLADGKLLIAEDLAWIANLDPASLAGASDELAVTALQARRALSCARKPEKTLVHTFATLNLNPEMGPNRAYLREKLLAADNAIEEDNYPAIQKCELPEHAALKPGKLRILKEALIPFSARALRREFKNAQLPQIPEILVPLIEPVAGVAGAVAAYESENGPLDLPALRGWKGARRALPAPKGMMR
jgi:hypothetical protein